MSESTDAGVAVASTGPIAHLLMRLEAPLMSFGAVAVDSNRPTQLWPAVSMLTGLLANALGWRRTEADRLNRLQERLVWAARLDRPGFVLRDFQTAHIGAADSAWTTRGAPEGRAGGPDTYKSPHIRLRDYRADASVAVALRLDPADEAPTLDELAAALRAPVRPLFIGRKACLPATPLVHGVVHCDDALAALEAMAPAPQAENPAAVFFNAGATRADLPTRSHSVSDKRHFGLDAHMGRQTVFEWLRPQRPSASSSAP